MAQKSEKSETKEETKVQAEQEEQAAQEARVIVVLNPATELAGYVFSDGKSFTDGNRYDLSASQYEEYAETKADNGRQIIIKES